MKTTSRNHRRGFTLVEIMIVVAVIGLLATIAVPNFMRTRTDAQRKTCIQNLKQLETAKQLWGLEKGKTFGDLPLQGELVGPGLFIKAMPECPAGGIYTITPVGTNSTCTIEGHVFE